MKDRKNLEILLGIVVSLIASCLSTLAVGNVIYVDGRAPGVNDGSDWANAYLCLQDALAGAQPQDEIRVAKGIYRPDCIVINDQEPNIVASGDREATFQLINEVVIKGGYAGFGELNPDKRDIEMYETVLSGDLGANDIDVNDPEALLNDPSRADNSYQIVTGNGTDETAVLDGFTIKGGNAAYYMNRNGGGMVNDRGSPQVLNCVFSKNTSIAYGGAVYNYYSNPKFVNCTFIENLSEGAGVYNYQSHPSLEGCKFTRNSAHNGAGIRNEKSNPTLRGCEFVENIAQSGAAISNLDSSPSLFNCTFTGNRAEDNGAGIYSRGGFHILSDCAFRDNLAEYGGGATYFNDCDVNLNNCTFIENQAGYGGGMYNSGSNLILTNCMLVTNSAHGYGGGMYNISSSTILLSNCLVTVNHASSYGGGMSCNRSDLTLTNCTFAENSAPIGSTMAFNSREQRGRSTVGIIACIIWDGVDPFWLNDLSTLAISYSNIQDGWDGEGNIDSDPLFVNQQGPDEIAGTEDDDFRLAPLSPCIDTGDPGYAPDPNKTDLDGNPRIVGSYVDMGAYEFQGIIYVDDDMSDLPGYGTEIDPFVGIQEAIDIAKDGYTVLVKPGVYGKIDFRGKAITVTSIEGAAVIKEPWSDLADDPKPDAVTFHTGEGPESVLKNFIIKDAGTAISLNYGSSPTIRNLTIVDNDFGIAAYENSNPHISNCIFWNNRDGDLFQCGATYSCVETGILGQGNITVDPLFVDMANGDYHLLSQGWYWSMQTESWAYDNYLTSPCIDAGNPDSPLFDEPVTVPRDPGNRYGLNTRINMGAYGGTSQASMSPLGWIVPKNENASLGYNSAQ